MKPESKRSCPVCESADILDIHHANDVPVFMNSMKSSAHEARNVARGQLDVAGCRACGFVWNAAFDSDAIDYDENYENSQGHSGLFADHLEDRARAVLAAVPAGAPIDYLEVGCGQGQFIDLIAELAGPRLRSAIGFDPAWRGEDIAVAGNRKIVKAYFGPDSLVHLPHSPNIVVTRHTIEHVPDPVAFLSSIRNALRHIDTACVFVETPRVEWIFDNVALHDFFYEHCSLFSEEAMRVALLRSGYTGVDIAPVFGDQYLWARAEISGTREKETVTASGKTGWLRPLHDDFGTFIGAWRDKIQKARQQGPVALWGAGAKGVSFALLVDPDGELIDHVIDINPAKQGDYLPGTGLAVLSPQEAAERRPAAIFVMNPNYLSEIETTVRDLGLDATLEAIN